MKVNPWLNYTEHIHRLREFGLHLKEFDLVDESLLFPEQIRSICCYLFNLSQDDLPHPEIDKKLFLKKLSVLIGENSLSYSLGKKKMLPWVDIHAVTRIVNNNKGGCHIS